MGNLHKTTGKSHSGYGNKFKEWRVYLNENHYAFVTFRDARPFRFAKWVWVYNVCLIDETEFDNPSDYALLEADIEIILERQKRLYPEVFKVQKKQALKEIKYKIKNYPKTVEKPKVAESIAKWLPILRKRK
jgi:hypothetical protein